jgi:thiol-disulfide isomerase/thioredoxin
VRSAPLAILLVLTAACEAPRGGPPRVGDPVPAYAAATLQGQPASLESLKGAPVLMNVWATWCHPCRTEMPDLERLHRERGPRGLKVIGVSIDERGQEGAIRQFLGEFGISYPIWLDPDDHVSPAFGLIGVPGTYLISRDGVLLWSRVGPLSADDPALGRALDQALAGGGA